MNLARAVMAVAGAGVLAASMVACSDSSDAPDSDETANTEVEESEVGPVESLNTIPLDEWRQSAKDAAFIQRGEQCAELFPDAVTEKIADYIGPEIYNVEISHVADTGEIECFFSAKQGNGQGQYLFLSTTLESETCDSGTGTENMKLSDASEVSENRTADAEVCSDNGTRFELRLTAPLDGPADDFVRSESYRTETIEAVLTEEEGIAEGIPAAQATFSEE